MVPRKEKDMITMNRFDYLNSERHFEAPLKSEKEWSLDFVHSFRVMHIRGNCLDIHRCG